MATPCGLGGAALYPALDHTLGTRATLYSTPRLPGSRTQMDTKKSHFLNCQGWGFLIGCSRLDFSPET
jgi:hypothetical protein